MPNITKVSIIDTFSEADFLPLSPTNHSCYEARSKQELGDILEPSKWLERNNFPAGEEFDRQLDFTGIDCLLQTVSMHTPHIEELHLGSQMSKIPLSLFKPKSASSRYIREIAPRLRCFKCDCRADQDEEYDGKDEQAVILARIISEMPRLRTLSSSMRVSRSHWMLIFSGPRWPSLSLLDLGDVQLLTDELLTILDLHKKTLIEVKQRNIYFVCPEPLRLTGDHIGSCLRLRSLTLCSLASREEADSAAMDPYFTKDQYQDFAKRIMRWVPLQSLDIDDSTSDAVVVSTKLALNTSLDLSDGASNGN